MTDTLTEITAVVCHHFGLQPSWLNARGNHHMRSEPRKIAFWISRKLEISTTYASKHFNRHYSSVITGAKTVDNRASVDMVYRNELVKIIEDLCSRNDQYRKLYQFLPAENIKQRTRLRQLAMTDILGAQELPISHLKFSNGQ